MRKLILSLFLISFALIGKAQTNISDRIYEILGILIHPKNYDIDELLQKRNFKFSNSVKSRAGNRDQIGYIYSNSETKNDYMICYVDNEIIAVYFDTKDEDEFTNLLGQAKSIGFEFRIKNTDQVNRIDSIYQLKDYAITFTKELKNGQPYFVVKAVEIPTWNKYFQ